ncbi:hypothetical protein F4553_003647 [Allocatelliglobosispora scoriae]|uniref:DUF559 domain-containing protein n=1 Tax=Allocatelliglobosispora scoriae TaxID=643052 RepID=A0A841BS91_9ACTN|nr:DUF559 domain-containing protein [Allocatelliglobosispora scoriae]MBB5870268.1 hypothetical protein [Allocatelliglobosispora scoriae]
MPKPPYRPRELAWQMFRGSQATRIGVLTENQLRTSAWIRVRHDVYADSRLERDHALACQAAMLRLPREVVIGGASAAYLLGVAHAASFRDPVSVIAPASMHVGTQARLVTHHLTVDPQDISGRMTTAERTAWDVARWYEVTRAVAIIDTLLSGGLVTAESLAATAERLGSERAVTTFDLADGRSQSPPESALRVRLVLADLPKPTPQLAVRVADGIVLHPDLAWAEYKVAIEYDGEWHDETDQFHRDRQRLNLLVADGWIVLHVTKRQLTADFPRLVRQVKAALRSRGWRPA